MEDVAEAIARVFADPATAGQTYELAGPGVYTLRELVRIALHLIGKRRWLVPVPFAVAKVQARLFELLPRPPLTTGQVDPQPLSQRTGLIKCSQGLAHRSRRQLGIIPVNRFITCDTTATVRIGLNDAGVNREPLATDQPFRHATLNDPFKDLAKRTALAKSCR